MRWRPSKPSRHRSIESTRIYVQLALLLAESTAAVTPSRPNCRQRHTITASENR